MLEVQVQRPARRKHLWDMHPSLRNRRYGNEANTRRRKCIEARRVIDSVDDPWIGPSQDDANRDEGPSSIRYGFKCSAQLNIFLEVQI